MKKLHGRCAKGKRVLCILTDGTRFIDRFVAAHAQYVILVRHGRVRRDSLRVMTICKGETS